LVHVLTSLIVSPDTSWLMIQEIYSFNVFDVNCDKCEQCPSPFEQIEGALITRVHQFSYIITQITHINRIVMYMESYWVHDRHFVSNG
jgi:hypothetical protein